MYGVTDHYNIEGELRELGFFHTHRNMPSIYHTLATTSGNYIAYKFTYKGTTPSVFTLLMRRTPHT